MHKHLSQACEPSGLCDHPEKDLPPQQVCVQPLAFLLRMLCLASVALTHQLCSLVLFCVVADP